MKPLIMKSFYSALVNNLIAAVTNNFVWFAVTYWSYLETNSVLATSIVGGSYLIAVAMSGFWLGSIVDHHRKKVAMELSSLASLFCYGSALLLYLLLPEGSFSNVLSWPFLSFVLLVLFGVIAGNLRYIAMPTLITLLVPEEERDKANGLNGMIMGISFAGASVGSGLILGFSGMFWVLILALSLTLIVLIHISFLSIPEKEIVHTEEQPKKIDIPGTIKVVKSIPGLFGLIFFTTFNNFLGGVFMALMDAYGLSLVSLQVWGVIWGVLSFGFIFGGLYISRKGLGDQPLRTLFRVNIVLWLVCIFFTVQPSIVLLTVGMAIYISLVPFIEATEHTIIQKVVPVERQGRVLGFAQSIEQAASPITAFMIGPIAQFVFIPFMTTGAGVELIGEWFGTGPGRGIALVFTFTGIIGMIVTLLARESRAYKNLSAKYQEHKA